MIQFPETENRLEFYSTLDSEYPPPEHRPGEINEQTDMNVHAWVDYPIIFGETKIDYVRLFKHVDSIEGRLRLAKSCEDKITEKCELVKKSDSLEPSERLGDDFIISVEYFFLSLRSSWDIMAKLLTWGYGFNLEESAINMFTVRDQLRSADEEFGDELNEFLQSKEIQDFNKIRNRLSHHLMPKLEIIKMGEGDSSQRRVCLQLDQVMLPIMLPHSVSRPLSFTEDMIDRSFGILNELYAEPSYPENVMDADEDYLPRSFS